MTTTEALALTAKPIPNDLAQSFFASMRGLAKLAAKRKGARS